MTTTTQTPHKAVLEFDLMDPDGRSAFKDSVAGSEYRLALNDIDDWMRGVIKHNSQRFPGLTVSGIEHARVQLHEILSARNIKLLD